MPRRGGYVLRLGTAKGGTPIQKRAVKARNEKARLLHANEPKRQSFLKPKPKNPRAAPVDAGLGSTRSSDKRPLPLSLCPLSGTPAGVPPAGTAQSLHSGAPSHDRVLERRRSRTAPKRNLSDGLRR